MIDLILLFILSILIPILLNLGILSLIAVGLNFALEKFGLLKAAEKKVGVFGTFGAVQCLISFGAAYTIITNLLQDPFQAIVFKLVPLNLVWVIVVIQLTVVALAIGVNLLYWYMRFGRISVCPRRIVYVEWAFFAALMVHVSRMLFIFNVPANIVNFGLFLTHNILAGIPIIIFIALMTQMWFRLHPRLERAMEVTELLPELDYLRVIIPSLILGWATHLLVESIFFIGYAV